MEVVEMTVKDVPIGENLALEVRYIEADFASMVKNRAHINSSYIVKFDKEGRIAIVDETAPTWYKELAALHEMINIGHCYEAFVPGLKRVSEVERRKCIDEFILSIAGSHQFSYRVNRATLYKSLLENGLCGPDDRSSIQKSYDMLVNPV